MKNDPSPAPSSLGIASSPRRAPRNLSVDGFKLLAAFGVVMIHLAPSFPAAEMVSSFFLSFSVPFFFVMALYFFVSKAASSAELRWADFHVDRIIVPYLVWTCVYTVMRLIKCKIQGTALEFNAIQVLLYGGVAVHLYFLPLLLMYQAQLAAALLWVRSARARWLAVGIVGGAYGFANYGDRHHYLGFGNAFLCGIGVLITALVLRFTQQSGLGRRLNLGITALALLLIGNATTHGGTPSFLGHTASYVMGYGIGALALNCRFNPSRPLARTILTCSYGIYLAHFGVLETLEFVVPKFLHYSLQPYTLPLKVLSGLVIFSSSALLVLCARCHWLSAYLFLGEGPPSVPTRPLEPTSLHQSLTGAA